MNWTQVFPGVWLYRDSCNVYAVEGPGGLLIVNPGTGRWLDTVDELPGKIAALACTHYFRDHSAGAAEAARRGIPIYVPEGERAIFADPEQHFRQRETYIVYDNLWDLFAPIEPASIAGVLRDYETVELAGMRTEVIPLPGVTITQCGLSVQRDDGRAIVFCGEAIHSPGRIARMAPLQYNYNDLSGAAQCFFSAAALRSKSPAALFPSLGDPIIHDIDGALSLLQDNLKALLAVRPGMTGFLGQLDSEPLRKVTDHVWLDTHSVANTWYLISESGKAMAIDYGYHTQTCGAWSSYANPDRRRALLHGMDGLKQQFGIDRIDVVLVSHFHDDHVCGIPVLQRVQGTQCWAADNFADLLAQPEAHCFPCNWPVACRVDRRLPLDQTFTWEEYTFRLHPMSGHTRFASLIGFEADGKRFAHTGDQYFFVNGAESFAANGRMQNHVYRNGALLDGYDESGKWMLDWRPDVVIQGHQGPMFTDDAFFRHVEGWVEDYAGLHRRVMPLEADEPHFNLDSWGGWIWPYRTHLHSAEPFIVKATVRNPFPRRATLKVRLVGPPGWEGSSEKISAAPRAEVTCELTMTPAGLCRRQPFAVELEADGQPFGQVAEALVTIGGENF
ncbi:MAG: MBL fold metallo-hydrolase [Chloroflexi bacterium]|nr:MBL fold metallo-hydrolase [Chloroflexota bacterium]